MTDTKRVTHFVCRQLDDDGFDWDILARTAEGELVYSDGRWGSREEALQAMQRGEHGCWWPEAPNSADRLVEHEWTPV